jgi:hypothetical protein
MTNLGSINAAHIAIILDAEGKQIGTCMDTPNNAAHALKINNNAMSVKTVFNGTYTREQLQKRFFGLDENYHKQFINFK